VLRNWNALAPVTAYVREKLDVPALWENFEYMAMLSQQYADRNPVSYPEGMPHMPVDDSLIRLLDT
jgi:hypothetical protein